MINMVVSTGLLPVTGQQLPFISKGGSSMLMTGFAVGMILSVTRNVEEVEERKQEIEENTEPIETEQIVTES